MSPSFVSVMCRVHTASMFVFIVNRWKGENVSTTEVADVITLADCIKEVNVYGVEVPGNFHSLSSFFVCFNRNSDGNFTSETCTTSAFSKKLLEVM